MSVWNLSATDRLVRLGRIALLIGFLVIIIAVFILVPIGLSALVYGAVAHFAGHPIGQLWHYSAVCLAAAIPVMAIVEKHI